MAGKEVAGNGEAPYVLKQIPIALIDIPEARQKKFTKNEENNEFVQWLERTGHLINPVNVRPKGDRYELIIGIRRFLGAKKLGWTSICCKVETWTDDQVRFLALIENLHRHKMKPAEEALANQSLLAEFEKLFGSDPKRAIGGETRAATAHRDTKGRMTKGSKKQVPISPSAPAPATAVTAVAGQGPVSPEPAPAPSKSFSRLLAEETGKPVSTARKDVKVAETLTAEQLHMLELSEVTREELITIAGIQDKTDRDRVAGLVVSGCTLVEAIADITTRPEISVKARASADEKAETDEEWLENRCANVRTVLQDTKKFDRDALLYRHDRDARSVHRGKSGPTVQESRKSGWTPFAGILSRVLFVCHPNEWFICDVCFGKNVEVTDCTECKSCGYKLRDNPPRTKTR